MFLSALVLVSINRKHNGLKKGVDLSHANKAAKSRDMTRLRLKEEEQVSILLSFPVIRERALLQLRRLIEMACNLILLHLHGQHILP